METLTLIIESPKYGTFEVLYDAEDEDKINKYKWKLRRDKSKFYIYAHIPHPDGGRFKNGRQRQTALQLHRYINNTPKGMDTDHINGNTMDNRKQNLRTCTRAENSRNRNIAKNNTSGYKWVTLYKTKKRPWRAQINFENKSYYLGCFKDKEEAARAYDKKAIELHGEYASTNFPIEDYQ